MRCRLKAFYQFTQQRLPTCKPVLRPSCVISILVILGVLSIPVGLITLRASESVIEVVDRYDLECVPNPFLNNKTGYIKDDSIPKNCTRYLKVPKLMKAPIYIYYQLDNFYQNHRRYVKSRSDKQLLHGLGHGPTSTCKPEEYSHDKLIVPCGLIAWSLFNDTYSFFRGTTKLQINRKNIAWESDKEHKFGKDVYPSNFQNGSLIGGAKLDPNLPLREQDDLIVWMRTAALPNFRKFYGKIEEDLYAGDIIVVNLMNNYNTYVFGGAKKIVISTTNWLGQKNDFLGLAYLFVGSFTLIVSLILILLHVKNPRPFGDLNLLSWNQQSNAT